MTDHLSDFLSFLNSKGISARDSNEIIPDDKRRRYSLLDDKANKKTGSYQLSTDGAFAYGWALDFREGVTHPWHSKGLKTFSVQERVEYAEKIKEMKKKQETERKALTNEAAKSAAVIWQLGKKVGSSPYLEKKQVELNGARFTENNKIIIPIYREDKIRSLQYIYNNGFKQFLENGELKGGFWWITTKEEDKSVLLIAEGFSTAASIRKATGLPVIIGFNASNMVAVVTAIRKKYPQSTIVICADNDAFVKKPNGAQFNPGIHYAQQAAGANGGAVVTWPEFPDNEINKFTDFNDAYIHLGAEYVKQRIISIIPQSNPCGASGNEGGNAADSLELSVQSVPTIPLNLKNVNEDNWQDFLIMGDKGVKNNSLQNMILFLRFHENFKGVFAYNEFHQNIVMIKCPVWGDRALFEVDRISDIVVSQTTAELEKLGQTPDINRTYKAIQVAAHYNKFHPAREYFNNLKWDGKPRLKTWLKVYLGCQNESDEYLEFVGRKWLTAGVTRIFHPGRKFDHVLVIEGEQGAYKSTSLKKLATFGIDKAVEYFTDSVTIADIQNKDTIMKIQGSVIVELSELSGFSKKDDEEIKRWITLEHDNIRLPYGRETSLFKRQFILAATTNRYDYLKDPTGNRRYWPVRAGSRIDIVAIDRDKEQLWAEAVAEYKGGLYLAPTHEEEGLANTERHKRLAQDAWTDVVLEKAHQRMTNKFKVADIMSDMGMVLRDKDDRAMRRISSILQIHGYENKSKWNPDRQKTERFWVRKDMPEPQLEMSYDEEEIVF